LAQLVGSYQIDVPNGDQLEIKLATQGDWQGAIVQRLGSVGDQWLIYDEDSRFTLCSMDEHVEAVMLKGTNIMHTLTWYNNAGTLTLWRRMGNRSSAMNYQALQLMSTGVPRPSINANVVVVPSEVDSKEGSVEHCPHTAHNSNFSDDDLFYILQAHCINDPVVLEKALCWGIARTPNRKAASEEIADLGIGRFWVSARLSESFKENCEKYKEILNEIKGAYQQVSTGVYLQPAPEPSEPGIQHRLRRSNSGYWIIEELNLEGDVWLPCTQELSNGKWVECTSGLEIYRIQIIPM